MRPPGFAHDQQTTSLPIVMISAYAGKVEQARSAERA